MGEGEGERVKVLSYWFFFLFSSFLTPPTLQILDCMINLHLAKLLPEELETKFNFEKMDGSGPLYSALSPEGRPAKKEQPSDSMSIFSTFSSYLYMTAEEEPAEPSPEDMEAEVVTKECIASCDLASLIVNSRDLQPDSLIYLIKALILASVKPGANLSEEQFDLQTSTSVLCLELLVDITMHNRDRVIFLWLLVYEHFASIINSTTNPSYMMERAIVGLLHLCIELLPKVEISEQIIKTVKLFQNLSDSCLAMFSEHLGAGALELVSKNATSFNDAQGWKVIFGLVTHIAAQPTSQDYARECVKCLMVDNCTNITPANFVAAINTIVDCVGIDASFVELMNFLPLMNQRLFHLSFVSPSESVSASQEFSEEEFLHKWMLLLRAFCVLSCSSDRLVRNNALLGLQQTLLDVNGSQLSPNAWKQCFNDILFRLFIDMLHPNTDEFADIDETRLRASKLLSQVFLQYLNELVQLSDFEQLWLRILGFVEEFLKAGHSKLLAEAVPESLKNMLLVMSSSPKLNFRAPETEQEESSEDFKLWVTTWRTIDEFLPGLKAELFPQQQETGGESSQENEEKEGEKEEEKEGEKEGEKEAEKEEKEEDKSATEEETS
eukprot:TRINITY_DN336_c1_g1_i9.p1 TRINITY_DN336_c1_g1~~TRINITY_DN336_c1_g1_i9.p1  ORF type:complete len:609 (+),score=245.05 TRINITY_DN336_c1_g1_i9:3189-5015(+)